MKRTAVVGVLFKREGAKRAEVTTVPYSIIDIEFEELEQKSAPQSETSYLDNVLGQSYSH